MRNTLRTFSRARVIYALSLGLLIAACGSGPAENPDPGSDAGHRVLLIGNSLTYTNDLPGMLRDIVREAGDTITTRGVSYANFALIDHINQGSALPVLSSGRWDVVVLQQGPTTLGINRDSLILWTQMFDPYIRAAGGRPALMMAWTDSANLNAMPLVHQSFEQAASAVNGLFLPVGEAWLLAWQSDPALPLYGDDNFHPSTIGTAIAALVIAEQVTGRDARTMPTAYLQQKLFINAATVRILQSAAHNANVTYAHP